LEIIKNILASINQQYSIVILFGVLFISLFFGLSKRKGLKIFIIIAAALSLIAAFIATIYNFRSNGAFSSFLFNLETQQVIEICVILFIALNILIFISLNNINKNQFIKIIIIFLFSVCSLVLLSISSNFIMIFVSFTGITLGIFQLLAVLNNIDIRSYLVRFFLVSTLAVIILLASFSIFYGSTDFKNFTQVFESKSLMANPIFAIGIILFSAGIYLYLFIFPFQGSYLKMLRRCEQSSMLVIWFLYFPAGIFMFMKINKILFYFIEKNSFYLTILFIFIAFVCILCGNIGAIKTKSIRRILAFIFLSFLGVSILSYAMVGSGLTSKDRVGWFFMANIVLLVLSYFPIYGVITTIEKSKKTSSSDNDSLENLKGFARVNKYIGINFIIILLSFLGLIGTAGFINRYFYIAPFFKLTSFLPEKTAIIHNMVFGILITATSIIAFVFLAVNILRLIIVALSKPKTNIGMGVDLFENKIDYSMQFAKFYYIYITAFSLIIVAAGVIGLLEILNINLGPVPFKITGL
jgi:NADH:ubiquinone oxidoreductase subunit 2 (subunit N)